MKVTLLVLVVALIAVPAMCWRYREWEGTKCSGSVKTSYAYSNDKTKCQAVQDVPNSYFTFTGDCRKGRNTPILLFSDSTCETRTGSGFSQMQPFGRTSRNSDPRVWYTSNGCQVNNALGYSWNIDCNEKV